MVSLNGSLQDSRLCALLTAIASTPWAFSTLHDPCILRANHSTTATVLTAIASNSNSFFLLTLANMWRNQVLIKLKRWRSYHNDPFKQPSLQLPLSSFLSSLSSSCYPMPPSTAGAIPSVHRNQPHKFNTFQATSPWLLPGALPLSVSKDSYFQKSILSNVYNNLIFLIISIVLVQL